MTASFIPSILDELDDVVITSPQNNQVLKYNSTSQKWENGTGGGVSVLDDLTDVVISSPASGQVLRHNGTNWVNTQLAHNDLSGIGANTHAQIDTHISSNHVNSFNGRIGAVLPAEGDYSLNLLSDVAITTPSAGHVIRHNGTSWLNAQLAHSDLNLDPDPC